MRPLHAALECVGDRWSLAIIDALRQGPRRFGELSDAVEGVSPNVLSSRLRHLADQRLLVARPYSSRPPRFEYELTDLGRGVLGAVDLLAQWGVRVEHGVDAAADQVGTDAGTEEDLHFA